MNKLKNDAGVCTATGSVDSTFEEAFVANLKRNEYYVGTLFETESAAAE